MGVEQPLVVLRLCSGAVKGCPRLPVRLTSRIWLVYTPRHCAWLNRVEIRVPILARQLLRRDSVISLDDVRNRVVYFIHCFNKILGEPFRWTYTGGPLQG